MAKKSFVLTRSIRVEDRDYVAGDCLAVVESEISLPTLGQLYLQEALQASGDAVEVRAPDEPKAEPVEEVKEEPKAAEPAQEDEPEVEEPTELETVDVLIEAGLTPAIAEALRLNASKLGDDRLTTPDGIREFVASGGSLEGLEKIGRTRVETITKVLGL